MTITNLPERVINRLRRLRRNRRAETADRLSDQISKVDQRLAEVVAGVANQAQMINDRLRETVAGLDNQSRLLNRKLEELIAAIGNQSRTTNDRLKEITAGVDNQSRLLATKSDKTIVGLDNQSRLLTEKLDKLIEGIKKQSQLLNSKTNEVIAGIKNLPGGDAPIEPPYNSGLTPMLTRSSNSPLQLSDDDDAALDAERAATVETTQPSSRSACTTNNLEAFRGVFDGIKPFAGHVPHYFIADFLGQLIDIEFHPMLFTDPNFDPEPVGNGYEQTSIPRLSEVKTPADAEAWFEAVDWVISAREATGRYVMITLGANYGAQAVGAYRALQAVNPLPAKLVAVEPVPGNIEWIKRHMRNNDIDPDQQWIVPLAISDTVEPLFFPVGGPGVGSNNCYSTNEKAARTHYADEFIGRGMAADALRNLLLNNTTGMMKDLVPGHDFQAEIKLVSAITLKELLGPFERIDLLESDIQQSEILVFPPFADLLRRKVRRIHVGTHGKEVHAALHNMFAKQGWEIIFSYEPNSLFESPLGNFETNDGVLTVRNPDL